MRGPARVRDADVAGERALLDELAELRHAPGAAQALQPLVHHREAGGVVAAVFEALQALEEDGHDVTARDGAHDSTHV